MKMEMWIELPALLRRLEDKVVLESELRRYLNTESLDDLLIALRYLERDGYFRHEVTLSNKYRNWARARYDVQLQADALNPPDPFGAMWRTTYGLSVKCETPLTRTEVNEVIRRLPNDMATRYLQFKLSDIDQEKLLDYVEAGLKSRGADEDELYDRIEYNGLVADGSEITYRGEPIEMRFQCRLVVRLLIRKQGRVCYKDEFTESLSGIFNHPPYHNPEDTLRKLISEARIALKKATNQNCIVSKPEIGWSLNIEP